MMVELSPCALCGRAYPHIHGQGLYPMAEAPGALAEIERIRSKNNKNWMEILRLAIKYAPEDEVAAVLEDIIMRDKQVVETCQRLLALLSR